jgi:dihydrofolate reductase
MSPSSFSSASDFEEKPAVSAGSKSARRTFVAGLIANLLGFTPAELQMGVPTPAMPASFGDIHVEAVPVHIRLFYAASLDGFIASPDGSVAWLEPYNTDSNDYNRFYSEIDTIVIGRYTYEQALTFGPWPYAGKRAYILRSRPGNPMPPDAQDWSGDLAPLLAKLRAESSGDTWVVGGGDVMSAFLALDAVDEIQHFVVPLILGDGIRAFDARAAGVRLRLLDAQNRSNGLVRLRYGRSHS